MGKFVHSFIHSFNLCLALLHTRCHSRVGGSLLRGISPFICSYAEKIVFSSWKARQKSGFLISWHRGAKIGKAGECLYLFIFPGKGEVMEVDMQERYTCRECFWRSVWPMRAWLGVGEGMGQTKAGRPGERGFWKCQASGQTVAMRSKRHRKALEKRKQSCW